MIDERLDSAEAELQHWIDGLLTSDEAMAAAPASLRNGVYRALSRKQRLTAACGLATAAAALAVVLLWPRESPVRNDHQATATPIGTPLRPAPVATFVGRGDLIVVPIESDDPTVTIVQVYATNLAKKRWRRKAAFQELLFRSRFKPMSPVRGG